MIKVDSAFSTKLEVVCEVIWAIALICLPLTSFPLLSTIYGGLVAPISILPFVILLLLWTLPLIFRKGVLPKETIPLMVFVLAVLVSCAAAFFIQIPGFKGKSIPGQEVRSLLTLAVGLTFFMVTTTWIKNTGKLKNTWKYITIGGIISLVWTGVQAFFILRHINEYPTWLNQIQSWLVIRSVAFSPSNGRVNGLTYEASWFAHQMVILYLPIWIAATYHRTSAFAIRIYRFSVENFLLVFGLAAFFLSLPRIGLLSFLLMTMYLFLRLNIVFHRWLVERLSALKPFVKYSMNDNTILIRAIASIGIFAVYILVIGGVFIFAVQRDWRLSTLVSKPPTMQEIIGVLTLDQNTILELSHRFIFLERAVYWLNGWNVFNQYPWFGVGLGNSGFFFPQMAPSIGWATFEIRSVLFYLTQLPNVKSLWFRLLAETGLIGFSVFIGWIYVLFQSSRFSQHHQDASVKTFAFAGQLALLAFIGEGLSIDSFAMPYFWVVAGIVAALAMMFRQEALKQEISN
jgi:hypothetical protein